MPNWQVFDKYAVATPEKPFATIQRGGTMITLNGSAYQLLGSPEAVELLFDPEEQLVGLRPTDSSNPRAYIVRAMAKSSTTHTIAGRAFTQRWRIDTSVALRYPVYMDHGDLIVDLKQKGVDVTGVRLRVKTAPVPLPRYKGTSPK